MRKGCNFVEKKRNAINYNDVTIMYGTTIISGMQTMPPRPELLLNEDVLALNCCKATCNMPSPVVITFQKSKQVENFLKHMEKTFWSISARKHHCYDSTTLCIPAPAETAKERKIQDMNYGSFVHTMAEMLKKYAPQLLI